MTIPPEAEGSLPGGSDGRAGELLAAVYSELRGLAAWLLRGERREHTLPATALVHEAYLKLTQSGSLRWESKRHFIAVAARAMRQILVDHERTRRSERRGGGRRPVVLDRQLDLAETEHLDLVALDDSLQRLERIDPLLARIVELRFFGGMSVAETAALLSISTPTVKRHWQLAKAWLYQEVADGRRPEP